ncbi:MAG: N-formylglutamate amidohydrolase [Hyphomicrobiaceae bacterium]
MRSPGGAGIDEELSPPFRIHEPAVLGTPFVFCSPHSGRVYPASFVAASRLSPQALRKSEDCFVDELFVDVAALGAPLLAARFPRAYIDVNREPYELDPDLFNEPLPPFANTQSVRVVGGLGTIARIVADAEEIYRERLTVAEALGRIERLYKPFHGALSGLLERAQRAFGVAILVDCHSMPSTTVNFGHGSRPDFVLGDRFGVSCNQKLVRRLRELLTDAGYTVHLNRPYAGGFITEHYGKPTRGFHAVQIEINRGLYMNEATFERAHGFDALREDLAGVMAQLLSELPGAAGRQAAAE